MALVRSLLKVFLSCLVVGGASSETYSARVSPDYINVVSSQFLSFTIDPKYLFSSTEKYASSQECICMAASLSPAYLRIAGLSTAHMTFNNSTITILPEPKDDFLGKFLRYPRKRQAIFETNAVKKNRKTRQTDAGLKPHSEDSIDPEEISRNLEILLRQKRRYIDKVEVTSDEWKRFSAWAKATGFEIVFALNNEEKTGSGLWDPNTALDILSVADKEGVEKMFWQLGYECSNQSIDEYLNDLETLRVIVDTFPRARARGWRVAGADVTGCLREGSRSDFKDYVALSLDMTDVLMLDGNSSSHELERLSLLERSKLLRTIHASAVPLWVSERDQDLGMEQLTDLERAAAWMASLGHSARRGAQVHFRELSERELYKPTLSYYMALLFKNLVGERVLTVDIDSPHTVFFAHCTSLRQKPIPGAVTLFGANMDDETARLSLKLSNREEGGDIMQFILSEDESGNIIVNGHIMSQEGDIRPVVRRVRPYKTLLLNLPAQSFGFWVVANTKVEACQYSKENDGKKLLEAESVEDDIGKRDKKKNRNKRSLIDNEIDKNYSEEHTPLDEYDVVKTGNKEFDEMLQNINNYLREMHNILTNKPTFKVKRQTSDEGPKSRKLKRQLLKIRKDLMRHEEENKPLLSFIGNLLQFARNGTKHVSTNMLRNSLKIQRNKISKRHNLKEMVHNTKDVGKRSNINQIEVSEQNRGSRRLSRTRRDVTEKYNSLYNDKGDFEINNKIENGAEALANSDNIVRNEETVNEKYENVLKEDLTANEVETNDNKKLWEVLHNIQSQLKRMSVQNGQRPNIDEEDSKSKEIGKLVVKTEITDDGATVNLKEQPNTGWVKSTFESIFHTLNDLNENMNRFWDTFPLFE